MAKAKQGSQARELTASHSLLNQYAFAVGERVTGPGITGESLTQDEPWTVLIKQD